MLLLLLNHIHGGEIAEKIHKEQEEREQEIAERRANGEYVEDDEEDFDEGALSLSAMEAELRDGVMFSFDDIAGDFKKLRVFWTP